MTNKTYRFVREGGGWFIDLPEYIEQGGSKADLAMVAGADDLLDLISGRENEVTLSIDLHYFEGADKVELVEVCDPAVGGGYYLMKTYNGEEINRRMWLCDVTEYVFGHLPSVIYVQNVS